MNEKQQVAESVPFAESPDGKKADVSAGTRKRGGSPFRWTVIIAALLIIAWILHVQFIRKPAGVTALAETTVIPAVVVQAVESGPAEPPHEFVGHVEAVQSVDLRAEVVGRIDSVHFEEGALVEAGDLLFTIRQAPYRARVKSAQAQLAKAKADLIRAEKLLNRLKSADPRSVVQTDLDTAESTVLQDQAAVQQAQAGLELAEIDLEYTEIRAPISGKIGRAFFTKGNYVGPSVGALAHLVQQDPVRVVYSMSDREYLQLFTASRQHESIPVEIRLMLPDETIYPGKGIPDFADNEMNVETSSIALRDKYANPEGLLISGTYVTVLMTKKEAAEVVLIPQEAVLTDDLGYFTYVVGDEKKAEERRLQMGAMSGDSYCVRKGLQPGEKVIVKGIQRVQAGQSVQPTELHPATGGE